MSDSLAPPTTDPVLAERHGGVLVLTLNRPDRLNAWNDALEARYYELLDAAEDDPEVKAIVVTGAGRGFCAGADLDRSFAESVAAADDEMIASFPRPDVTEGVRSYTEQRPPAFPSLPPRS